MLIVPRLNIFESWIHNLSSFASAPPGPRQTAVWHKHTTGARNSERSYTHRGINTHRRGINTHLEVSIPTSINTHRNNKKSFFPFWFFSLALKPQLIRWRPKRLSRTVAHLVEGCRPTTSQKNMPKSIVCQIFKPHSRNHSIFGTE